MNGFNKSRKDQVSKLNSYRTYEIKLIHKYGVEWRREMTVEEETELEKKKNKVDWTLLSI